MKKITMICMAALLLLAASCKKENEGETNEPTGEEGVFRVETEVHSGDSKTHIEDTKLIWDNGDAINVINGSGTSHVFQFSKYVDEGDKTTAEFGTTNLPEGFYTPNYTAYYPSDFNPSNYSMPQTQTYSAYGFDAGANPMIATNEPEKLLHFKNVLGILELQLKSVDNSMTVKEIRVRSNDINEKLWGNGSVVNGEFKVSSGGSNTVKLNCGSVTINSTTPTSFFILLPPGTLSGGFEVDVVDTDGEFWITKTTNNNIINRSRTRRMPAVSVKTCTSEDVQLWYNAPYWATKNLGAENPWNYGDYYQWGVSPDYYGDGIPTLYLSANKPAQTGTGSYTINLYRTAGYHNCSTCPYWTSGYSFSKYTSSDGLKELVTGDDIAYQLTKLDEKVYHMPNNADFNLMLASTTASNVTYHGVNGWKYTGIGDYNDRFIFFPRAGWVGTWSGGSSGSKNQIKDRGGELDYWSSTLNTTLTAFDPYITAHVFSDMSGGAPVVSTECNNRWFGQPVRPIRPNN